MASTVIVILGLPFGSASTIRLRPASSSVMSARSCCVTIGMVRQPTVRFLAIVWRMLRDLADFDRPELAEVRQGRQREGVDDAPAHRGRTATLPHALALGLDEALDVVERDAPAAAAALDFGEANAQFAGQPPRRGTGGDELALGRAVAVDSARRLAIG